MTVTTASPRRHRVGQSDPVVDREFLGPERTAAVEALADRTFTHRWQLRAALEERAEIWRGKEPGPLNDEYNKVLGEAYDYVFRHFHLAEDGD